MPSPPNNFGTREDQRPGKFQLSLRQLIEDLMVQRMSDNDKIVTRYMDDKDFGSAAFTVPSKAIYDSIPPGDTSPQDNCQE